MKMKDDSLKNNLEKILLELKNKGWTRQAIEQKLGYSENYIDQQLSKGGNKRFLNALVNLNSQVLQKAIEPLQEEKKDFADKSLSNLTESNKVLSDANRTLAEANKTLAEANLVISKNHDELIQLTKMIVANSGQLTKVPVVHQSKGTSKEIRQGKENLSLDKKYSRLNK